MSSIVATYQLNVTLRREEPVTAEAAADAPTVAEVERIAEEALRSYKAAFGVDTINVSATRTDE